MKKIKLIFLMCFASFMLVACSKEGDNSNTVTIARTIEISNLDPALEFDNATSEAFVLTQGSLLKYDEDRNYVPNLAKSYEISDDKKTYTFHLREDALYSNGDPIIASDYVYELDRVIDGSSGSEFAYLYDACYLESYEAPDDYTFVVHLSKPNDIFLQYAVDNYIAPVNPKFAEEKGDLYGTGVDTSLYWGPYVITEWNPGDNVIFEKNPLYFDADKVKENPDKIIFKITSGEAALMDFLSDNISFVPLTASLIPKYQDDPRFKQYNTNIISYMVMNMECEPLCNPNVRAAMYYGIDNDAIASNVMHNNVIPLKTLCACDFYYYEGEDFVDACNVYKTYDLELAKEYAAKAKEELGDISFTITGTDAESNILAYVLNQLNNELGFDCELVIMPKKSRIQCFRDRDYDMILSAWGPDYNNAISFLELFETDNVLNTGKYHNEAYDAAMKRAKTTDDMSEQWQSLVEADDILLSDYMVIPIYQSRSSALVSEDISGIQQTATGNMVFSNIVKSESE